MRIRRDIIIFSGALLAACSHIPNPADAPGVEPYDIIQTLRCEVREALEADYHQAHWIRASIIGYGLTLTAEENRNKSGALSATWPIHLGTFSLDLKAGGERQRIGESRIDFVEAMNKAACAAVPPSRTERLYPITGRIGLREIIRRFVLTKELEGTFTKDVGFVHTLEFKLKFSGGVKPSFAISEPSGRKFSGNVDVSADRKDTHKLIVKLAPPPVQEVKKEEIIKVEIVKLPLPPGAPPTAARRTEERNTTETRTIRETPQEAAQRAERQMLRGIQEERRLRLDEEIRDIIRSVR